ncbi:TRANSMEMBRANE PROTEIN [Salix viminalis]|uniref:TRANSMEMBRANE PROTEIN n=1 Tax=Salix viminalis TaxID=40686 RepID=A0A9Q0NZ60_SALVM|nr:TRANSMEMBRANE PROTEIN [Salix viminalis]
MGGLCCKTRRSGSQLTAQLRSYEVACKRDPILKSFDATLHERTNHVISSLATSVEIQSLGSFKKVTTCLLETNQDIAEVLLECKEDILDSPELFDLVEEYFKSSVKTMDFCTALEICLDRAKNSQLIIELAIKQFEEEVQRQDGAVENKFVKTLDGLQQFKAAGDPFTPQFFDIYESVRKQQESMFKKLISRMKKLDKKLKSVQTWRRVSNVLFVSASVSVLIFSVLAAAVAAPPAVTALAAAMPVPIGSVGNWCNTLWDRYEIALKEERGIVKLIRARTYFRINDMENVRVLVTKLQGDFETLLHAPDIFLDVKVVIDVIKRKMAVFMKSIEDLSEHAGKCRADIIEARTAILNRIRNDADQ